MPAALSIFALRRIIIICVSQKRCDVKRLQRRCWWCQSDGMVATIEQKYLENYHNVVLLHLVLWPVNILSSLTLIHASSCLKCDAGFCSSSNGIDSFIMYVFHLSKIACCYQFSTNRKSARRLQTTSRKLMEISATHTKYRTRPRIGPKCKKNICFVYFVVIVNSS